MNRKGDVPMILLFLVAITLSLIALFAFASFRNDNLSVSKDVNLALEKANSNYARIIFEAGVIAENAVNCDCSGSYKEKFRAEAEKREKEALALDGIGNFFGKVRNDEFVFESRSDGYVLEVKGVFVEGKSEKYNKITRNFDINMRFDSEGRFINKT